MNLAWKLVVFTIMINISSGFMVHITDFDDKIQYNESQLAALDVYDVQNSSTTVLDQANVQSETNWADNLLGLLGLGFIVDIMNMFTDYLYGIIDVLEAILPAHESTQYFLTLIKALITLMYTLSLFALFTGKELNKEG